MMSGPHPLPPALPLGRPGRWAIGLFTLHTLLLFFPPIPPDVKGSLWSYLLASVAMILASVEIWRHATRIIGRWSPLPAHRQAFLGTVCGLGMLLFGLLLRMASPELFDRWGRPEGVWEPLTILSYVTAGFVLVAAGRGQAEADRKHLHFFAIGYALLVLEELDYFGVFGGIIGRVNGVYLGAPHDLIGVALEGLLAPWMLGLLLLAIGIFLGTLLWRGYLQPMRVLRTLFARRGLWLLAGAFFLGIAQIEDIGAFYFFGQPRIEELLELVGAIFLLGFAADLAGGWVRRAAEPASATAGRSR